MTWAALQDAAWAWVFANAEELLPLAYDVALACRNDPLLEPLSRVDMDWLLLLLGRAPAAPPEPPSRPAPRQVEYIEAPPEPRRRAWGAGGPGAGL